MTGKPYPVGKCPQCRQDFVEVEQVDPPEYADIHIHGHTEPIRVMVSSGWRVACLNPDCPHNEIARWGPRSRYTSK